MLDTPRGRTKEPTTKEITLADTNLTPTPRPLIEKSKDFRDGYDWARLCEYLLNDESPKAETARSWVIGYLLAVLSEQDTDLMEGLLEEFRAGTFTD